VIVWARKRAADEVRAALVARYPDFDVLHLPIARGGAGPV
jgi:hypothetical protein